MGMRPSESVSVPVRATPAAFCLLFFTLLLLARPPQAEAQDTVRVSDPNTARYPTVRVPVSVERAGDPVQGLSREDFRLVHDGSPVSSFEVEKYFDSYAWLGIALVLDRSGSMEGRPLMESKRAIKTFLRSLGRRDRAALITFDDEVRLRAPFGATREEVISRTEETNAGGDTALRDAIVRAAARLDSLEAPRRAMVVLTDGRDTASGASLDQTLRALGQAGWRCFTIGLGPEVNDSFLRRVAEVGGGSYFPAPKPEDLTEVYRRVARELESRYLLTYRLPGHSEETPSRPSSLKRHSLRVVANVEGRALAGGREFTTGSLTSAREKSDQKSTSAESPEGKLNSAAVGWWKTAGLLFAGGLAGTALGAGALVLLGLSISSRPGLGGLVIGLSGLLGTLLAAAALLAA